MMAFSESSTNASKKERGFHQWVDYLPSQLLQEEHERQQDESGVAAAGAAGAAGGGTTGTGEKQVQRVSSSDSNMTENTSMDMEDWPDSTSLLDGSQLLPPALLVDHDPLIQHELMLFEFSISDGSSMAPEMFANSLEELLEQRRHQLAASMQASQRTRQFLEPHIRQRAGLSNVLQQIERSSLEIHHHLLQQQHLPSQAPATTMTCVPEETNSIVDDAITGIMETECDLEDVEDFARQVLAGHDDDDDQVQDDLLSI